MAKRRQFKVSWHEPSGQFTKWIGGPRGKDGTLKPKCFYLGSDQTIAISKAASLQQDWKTLKSQGHTAWPEQVKAVEINPIETTPAG